MDFGTGTLGDGQSESAFAAEFDSNGLFRWAHAFGSATTTVQSAVDGAGDSFFAVTGGTPAPGGSTNNIAIVKLDPDGNVTWTDRVTSTDQNLGFGVVVTDIGSLVIAGTFGQDVTFSKQFGSATYTNAQPAAWDIFVAGMQHP